MADGKVTIQVENNARQASRDFDRLDKELRDVEKSAGKADNGFGALRGTLGAVGGVVAGIGIAQLGRNLINLASDAEETANKFGVVFSTIRDDANDAVKNLTDNFGLARTEARQLLSDTGDLLTGFGFTQDEALGLSSSLNTLAVDLASFTNVEGGAERASSALTSALLGEREAVKSLGIAITEADINRLAEERGIVGELTRQQKAFLTLELAIEQSANAIGDYERSSDSYANSSRRFASSVRDLSETLGSIFLPTATSAVNKLDEFATSIENVVNSIRNSFQESALRTVNDEIARLAIAVEATQDRLREGVEGNFLQRTFGEQDPARKLSEMRFELGQLIEERQRLLDQGGEGASVSITSTGGQDVRRELQDITGGGFDVGIARTTDADFDVFLDNIKRADDEFKELKDGAIEDLGRGLSSALTTPFREGETAVQRFGNLALSIISQVAQELLTKQLIGLFAGGATGGVTASAKGNVFQGGNVQAFADGGVVSSPTFFPMANGGTGLMGEAGAEAIMPLRRGSGGRLGVDASNVSPTVNVFNQSDVSIETVVRPDNEVDVFVRRVNGVLASERSQGAFSTALSRQRQSGIQGA